MTRDAPALDPVETDSVLPVVERPGGGLSLLAITIIAGLAAVLLFGALESRRRSGLVPITRAPAIAAEAEPTLPDLYVPPEPPPVAPPPPPPEPMPPAPPPPPRQAYAPPPYDTLYRPPSIGQLQQQASPSPGRSLGPVRPALVVDSASAGPPAGSPATAGGGTSLALGGPERAEAGVFANPATTVPQGTVIAAVLESAIDTGRPSQVTALVQRDVRGFDGAHVLIPRGSRLIGELRTDALPGQDRANVVWTRLIRPDGATMALQSPAADPLGRAGVRGSVDSHFWARFGETLLQSSLSLGADLALRGRRNGAVVVLPGLGAAQQAAGAGGGSRASAPPTITVPAGRTVSVSVLRDLDFTRVGP